MVDLGLIEQADPNRESLTDLIGQGKYGAAAKQTAGMLIPQSFMQKPSLDTTLQDFVEFSPYGDAKDLLSGVLPGSGLDPLERGLAIVSALPLLGGTMAGAHFAVNHMMGLEAGAVKVHAASQAADAAAANAGSVAPGPTGVIDQGVDLQGSMIKGDGSLAWPSGPGSVGELGAVPGATPEARADLVANAAAEVWLKSNPDAALSQTKTIEQLTQVLVDGYGRTPSDEVDATFYEPNGMAEAALRHIGKALVQEFGEQIPVQNTNGVAFNEATRELAAAQYAMSATLTAARTGVLDHIGSGWGQNPLRGKLLTPDEIMAALFDTRHNTLASDLIYQVSKGLLGRKVGPDLDISVSQSIVGILVNTDRISVEEGKGAVVITGAETELLPSERTVDRNTGFVLDQAALNNRHVRARYSSLTGDFAATLLRTLVSERLSNPFRYARNLQWYHNAHATIMNLSGVTSTKPEVVAGLFSALSPRGKWTPNNLIAATHVLLRYTVPDLDPASPEYHQIFKEALDAGGWAGDLWRTSTKKLKKKVGAEENIVDHYATIENFLTDKGDNLQGFEMDTKKNAAMELLLMDVEWPVVVRQMKTSHFQHAILDPFDMFLVAVDTHQSTGMLGGMIFGEALVHKGVRPLGDSKKGVLSGEDVHEGPTGTALTPEMLEALRARYLELGATKKMADDAVNRARKVPDAEQLGRYEPAALAHGIVTQMVGMEATSAMQAATWFPFQLWKATFRKWAISHSKTDGVVLAKEIQGYVNEIIAKGYVDVADISKRKRIEALKQVWDRTMWDWSVADKLEGTPLMDQGIAGMVNNASAKLDSVVPDGYFEADKFSSTGQRSDATGQAILMAQRYDGTAEVWADESIPGVREALKNLFPVGISNGQYTRFVPRHAKITDVVETRMNQLAGQSDQYGRPVSADVRMTTSPVESHPAVKAGNRLVAEVKNRNQADQLVAAIHEVHPTTVTVTRSSVTHHGTGVRTLPLESLGSLHEESDTTFEDQDWVAISAELEGRSPGENRAAMRKLRKQLIGQVQKLNKGMSYAEASRHVIEQDGMYEKVPEGSFLVFGLPYDKAIQLGKQHGQNSVATKAGLIYTTGEDAGKFRRSAGETVTGTAGTFEDNLSTITVDGRKVEWQAQYDWEGDLVELPPDPNSMLNRGSTTEPVFQVTVELGGVENNLTSDISDRLIRAAQKQKPLSTSLYLHGNVWRPPGFVHAYESVYTDAANNVGSYRTMQDTGNSSPNQYDVLIPESESLRLTEKGADLARGRRTAKQARELATDLNEAGQTTVAGEVTIDYASNFEPEANINVPKGQVFQAFRGNTELHTKIRFEDELGTVVMEKVPWRVGVPDVVKGEAYVTGSKKNGYAVRTYDAADAVQARDALQAVGVESEPKFYGGPGERRFREINWMPETEYRKDGVIQAPKTGFRLQREVEWNSLLDSSIPGHPDFTLGDMFSDADAYRILYAVDHQHGGTLGKASPHIEAMVRQVGLYPKSFLGGTSGSMGGGVFYGGGIQSGSFRSDSGGLLGFTPPIHGSKMAEVSVWMSERLGALSSQLADLEYVVGRDKKRFPGLPEERGALVEQVLVHEQGHLIKHWYEINGFGMALTRRVDAFIKEVGGSRGIERLVSDYAAGGNELLSECMARQLHAGVKGSKVDPAITRLVKDVVAGMRAVEDFNTAPLDSDLAMTDQPVWDALFAGVRDKGDYSS